MSKLNEAQALLLDAKYVLDLIDLAIDSVAENSSPFTVATQTVREKLQTTFEILSEEIKAEARKNAPAEAA